MSDILMCSGESCELKTMCHRFTAKPNEYRQTYFQVPPIKEGNCDMFWGEATKHLMDQLTKIVNGK